MCYRIYYSLNILIWCVLGHISAIHLYSYLVCTLKTTILCLKNLNSARQMGTTLWSYPFYQRPRWVWVAAASFDLPERSRPESFKARPNEDTDGGYACCQYLPILAPPNHQLFMEHANVAQSGRRCKHRSPGQRSGAGPVMFTVFCCSLLELKEACWHGV